jgi:hypothetical protein
VKADPTPRIDLRVTYHECDHVEVHSCHPRSPLANSGTDRMELRCGECLTMRTVASIHVSGGAS